MLCSCYSLNRFPFHVLVSSIRSLSWCSLAGSSGLLSSKQSIRASNLIWRHLDAKPTKSSPITRQWMSALLGDWFRKQIRHPPPWARKYQALTCKLQVGPKGFDSLPGKSAGKRGQSCISQMAHRRWSLYPGQSWHARRGLVAMCAANSLSNPSQRLDLHGSDGTHER